MAFEKFAMTICIGVVGVGCLTPDSGEVTDTAVQSLGNACAFVARQVVQRPCGETIPEVYAGPVKKLMHGGTCISTGPQCAIEVRSFVPAAPITEEALYSTACGDGWRYVGVAQPWKHGGNCIRERSGRPLYSFETDDMNCDVAGGIYIGPARPDIHRGSCLYTD